MNYNTPSFDDLRMEIIHHEDVMWYNRNSNIIVIQPSSIVRLEDDVGREAVFRIRKDDKLHRVILTLCYSTFGGATSIMEGRTINFLEGAGLIYYHLIMLTCDPRNQRKKEMVKHEIDLPRDLLDNLRFERHEVVYGKQTSKKNGLCVIVEEDDIEVMTKVYFYEKLVPLMRIRLK